MDWTIGPLQKLDYFRTIFLDHFFNPFLDLFMNQFLDYFIGGS